MELIYKDHFEDSWLNEVFNLHNRSGMERPESMMSSMLKAFKARYAVITCWHNQKLVGFGTMISDGEMYSSIFDLVVDPEHQKQGIGKKIMELLYNKAPNTCIYLTSTFGNEQFYEKIGYKRHKTAFGKYPFSSNYLE